MKKLISLSILGILVLSIVGAGAFPIFKKSNSIDSPTYPPGDGTFDDEIDQYQIEYDGAIPCGSISNIRTYNFNLSIAQSFVPQKEILTKIEFFAGKNETAIHPLVIAIRDDLTGENLAVASVDPEYFLVYDPVIEENLSWIEFNFLDIKVNIGETYYLVAYTENATDNYYWLGGNGSDPYPDGDVYGSADNGETWEILPEGDGCFKTYGRDIPEWAQGEIKGVWGLTLFGLPLPEAGWIEGYATNKGVGRFEAIYDEKNNTNASNFLEGVYIGPFLLGKAGNRITGNGTLFVGIGGANETHVYFRIMGILGPTFYVHAEYERYE